MAKQTQITKAQGKAAKAQGKAQGTAVAAKRTSLFRFVQTPGGKLLRAYTIALMQAQDGFKVGGTFRLWPAAHVSGHTGKGNLEKVGPVYTLTAMGYPVFFDSIASMGIADTIAKMRTAVESGVTPEGMTLGSMAEFKL